MSFNIGKKIITNGLILLVDAANPRCFTEGDTTGTNIITGGLLTGASGTPGSGVPTPLPSAFPVYNSKGAGCFYFDGGKGINCDENLGTHSNLSMTICFIKTNSGGTNYFTDARNNGGSWFLSNYSNYNITYSNALAYNYDAVYNPASVNFLNKWIIMTVTSDSTGSVLYLNGEVISGGPRNSIDEDLGLNFRIGTRYTTSGKWVGYMGPILIYDYKQSAEEVLQNFNALRGRFGL